MNKHPDDEQFTDDELREMEAGLAMINAHRHVFADAEQSVTITAFTMSRCR
jgi:hypothetical protein